MPASAQSEPIHEFAEVIEVDGRQHVLLPPDVRVEAKKLHVVRSGESLHLDPVRPRLDEEGWKQWTADMQRFQQELGDFMPEGREQPPMPEPKEIFPDDVSDGAPD